MKKLCSFLGFIKAYLDFVLIGLLCLILFLPQETWDKMFGVFRFDHLLFAGITVLLILVCAANLAEGKRVFTKWVRENIWVTLFIAALLISVLFSTNPWLSLTLLPRCLSGIFIVYIIHSCELTEKQFRRILCFTAFAVIIGAVYAIIQRVQGILPNQSFTELKTNTNVPGRVCSFFDNPNVYSFALAMLLPTTAAYALDKHRARITIGTADRKSVV